MTYANKLKVMTIVGTRPEIIKLSQVIKVLDEETNHILVHTGQNYDYELNNIFFEDLKLRNPNYYLDAAGKTSTETISNVIIKVDEILEIEKPDAVLILGDTNSCLSVIAAKRRKIPIFHMEAGNRSFDERVPEEINRKILDHISDINLPYSDIAREYLLKEGLSPDRIIKIGSPMAEVYYEHFKANSFIFPEKWTKDILEKFNLEKNKFYLFSLHREESIENEKQINKLINVLTWMDENLQYPIIFSTHPRTKNRLTTLGVIDSFKNIKFMKPFSLTEYVALQINASIVFSDSGTISEETSLLQLKSLNLREAHERPEAMEEATVMMVGLDLERIKQGIDILNSGHGFSSYVADYTRHSIASKVLKIIISYTDYVKRNVWREEPHE